MTTATAKKSPAAPHIEAMKLSACIAMAHQKNPKEHDIPALIGSFGRFGFVAFPTIDEQTSMMVAGHGRCEALAKMKADGLEPPRGIAATASGDWMVPVIRGVSFDSERERDAYVIADNQHTIHGGWNLDKLSELLSEIRDTGFDGIGFDDIELDSLLGAYAGNDDEDGDKPDQLENGEGPDKFVRHDINVQTTYCCPKCSYEWSGKPK